MFRSASRTLVLDAARTALPRLLERGVVGECAADPARFALAGPGPASTWAYGGDLTPAHQARRRPRSTPWTVPARRSSGVGAFDAHLHSVFGGGVVVARVAAGGPCQVIGSFFPAPPYVQRLFGGVAILGLLVSAAGALAAWLVVVRPLVRRIAALRRAARPRRERGGLHVPGLRASGSPDDLDALGRALDRAHRRIVADAAALREKRHELRRPRREHRLRYRRRRSARSSSSWSRPPTRRPPAPPSRISSPPPSATPSTSAASPPTSASRPCWEDGFTPGSSRAPRSSRSSSAPPPASASSPAGAASISRSPSPTRRSAWTPTRWPPSRRSPTWWRTRWCTGPRAATSPCSSAPRAPTSRSW